MDLTRGLKAEKNEVVLGRVDARSIVYRLL